MNIANAIRACRTHKGVSQADLAKGLNVSPPYISLMEAGKNDPPWSTVELAAKVLGVPPVIMWFMSHEEEELEFLDPELAEKLALFALRQLNAKPDDAET